MIEIYKGRTSRTELDSDEFSNGNTTFSKTEQFFFNVFILYIYKLSYWADSLWQKIATDFINNPSWDPTSTFTDAWAKEPFCLSTLGVNWISVNEVPVVPVTGMATET